MFSLSPPQPSLFFAANRPRFSPSYAPQTPSPLRTSRNANLMSSSRTNGEYQKALEPQPSSSPLGRKFGDAELEGKENHRQYGQSLLETPFDRTKNANHEPSQLVTPPHSGAGSGSASQALLFSTPVVQPSTTEPSFSFSFAPQTSTSTSKTPSQWEARARSASPATSIARHAAEGRDRKKSQFLDRIRRRRDDTRAETVGDQVLHLDFVSERRGWEDEMRRRAVLEQQLEPDFEADEMDAEMLEHGPQGGGLSPAEASDVDQAELQMYFEELQRRNPSQEFVVDDIDGDEFDVLYLQAVSQSQDSKGPGQDQVGFGSSMDLS